jgi:PPOX class probable F420-dependent enzyme
VSSIPDSHRKIIEEASVVMLATIRPGGGPQVTATWFLWDGDTLRLSLNTSRQKVRNMRRNPAVSAFFLDPSTPYRTLELRGTARIEDDPDYVLAAKVGEKYGGADLRSMDRPGDTRVSVTLVIQKLITYGQ